jgi:hypothetical protein
VPKRNRERLVCIVIFPPLKIIWRITMNQRTKVIREVIDRFKSVNYENNTFKDRLTNEIEIELEKLENRRFTEVMSRLEKDE